MSLKKLKLPDGTVVDIRDSRFSGVDSEPTPESPNLVTSGGVFDSLRYDKIAPIKKKTFSGVIAITSNYNSLRPFFRVVPKVWDEPVIVVYRFRAYVSGKEDLFYSKHECMFSFFHESLLAYSIENLIGNTSYKNIYYNSLMACKSAYKTIGHLIGINYYSNGDSYSRSCTTSGYGRTFEIEIIKENNCTVEFLDSCETVSASVVPGYVAGTTHGSISNNTASTQGDVHTGDANTNTIGYNIRTPSVTRILDGDVYRYRILFSSMDGKKWIPSNVSTSTNATAIREVNQNPFNPFGEIVYYNSTSSIASGGTPSAANVWRQYELNLGYSFNRTGSAIVLEYPAPVYLKCAPQSDGTVIIDSTTPYVQTLPSTSDGKVYLFLGMAYSATNISLYFDHPIYHFSNGSIRLWTNMPNVPSVDAVAYLGAIVGTATYVSE